MTGKGGKRGVRRAIEAAEPARPAPDPADASAAPDFLGRAFEMRTTGLWRKASGEDKNDTWLCGHFAIEAETRDGDGCSWGLLISWNDREGRRHEEVFPRALFAGECAELRSRLADGGLSMNGTQWGRQALAQYLNVCRAPRLARSVTRVGWHLVGERSIFVLPPGRVFGEAGERIVLQLPERVPSLFNAGGTLAEWRARVSRRCLGNSRLTFTTSCAFGAPLLRLLGEDGGGFNLRGASRLGKSTALRVAASVCGGLPGQGAAGFVRQWRATSNGLETIAAELCDCLLPLDEMGQVDGREAAGIAYMLANGAGKQRATRAGGARPSTRFRVLFVSTGEIGLGEKDVDAGRITRAGQEVRLVDIPADAGAGLGLFEDLHDEADPDAFVQELRHATTAEFGTALPAFLEHLTAALRRDTFRFVESLRERVAGLLRGWLAASPGAGGQVRSVGTRFALVGIAGELASEAMITEWPPGAASVAAETCFRAWLAERGTVGAAEDAQAVRQLRGFIAAHGPSRFEVWADPRPLPGEQAPPDPNQPPAERFRTQKRASWRRWAARNDRTFGWRYYLTADGMKEALDGLAPRESTRTLAALGLIVKPMAGLDAKRNNLTGAHKVPGQGKVRLYEIAMDILAGDDVSD